MSHFVQFCQTFHMSKIFNFVQIARAISFKNSILFFSSVICQFYLISSQCRNQSKNVSFCPILSKMSDFVKMTQFCPKRPILSKMSNSIKNVQFCPKFPNLSKMFNFIQNIQFCPNCSRN